MNAGHCVVDMMRLPENCRVKRRSAPSCVIILFFLHRYDNIQKKALRNLLAPFLFPFQRPFASIILRTANGASALSRDRITKSLTVA